MSRKGLAVQHESTTQTGAQSTTALSLPCEFLKGVLGNALQNECWSKRNSLLSSSAALYRPSGIFS